MPRGAVFLRAGSSTGRKVLLEGCWRIVLSSPLGACSGTILHFFGEGKGFFYGVYLVFEHLLIIPMVKPIT